MAEEFNNQEQSSEGGAKQRVFFRRRRGCPLEAIPDSEINYKNIRLLQRFISERGRILPSRITSVSAKKQRRVKEAIKLARNLALLPFAATPQ